MKRARKLGHPKEYHLSFWYMRNGDLEWNQHVSKYYKRRGYPNIVIDSNPNTAYYNFLLVNNHEHS